MPSAIVTLPDGRKAKLSGPTREAVTLAAQRLTAQGVDPNTGATDPDLAAIDQLMSGTAKGRPQERNLRTAMSSIPLETSLPIAAATVGSIAFPPLGAARVASMIPGVSSLAGRVAQIPLRAAARTAPTIAGAAGGGAVAGGALEAERGGSAADIAGAAARTGAEMGLAEMAGLGIGAAASKFWAPNLRFLDPLKGVREQVVEKATVTLRDGRRAIDVEKLTEAWKRLPKSNRASLPHPVQDAVTETLGALSTVGAKLKEAGKFAASPVGGEIAEALIVPAATAMFGIGVGVPLMIGKALLNPGPMVRYLSRSELPSEGAQAIGGQAVRLQARTEGQGALDDEER